MLADLLNEMRADVKHAKNVDFQCHRKAYEKCLTIIDRYVEKIQNEATNKVIIDGVVYQAENPKLKTIHSKTGEVVIGGFEEVKSRCTY